MSSFEINSSACVEACYHMSRFSAVIYAARRALDSFGEHPDFLSSITTIKLHQRQPGLGQRSSLLAMVWRSLGLADVDISNQFSCYEMNGLVDWLEYVLPSAIKSPMNQQTTFSNRTMQLASITSNQYRNHVQFYTSEPSIECIKYIIQE